MWRTGIRDGGYGYNILLDDKWDLVYERDVQHGSHFVHAGFIIRDYWHDHNHRQRQCECRRKYSDGPCCDKDPSPCTFAKVQNGASRGYEDE